MPSFQEKTLMIKPQMNKKIPDRDLRKKKNTKEKALKEDGWLGKKQEKTQL